MKTLSIDIETYSSVDLAKCGVYKYTEATDFDILLFGYSTDGGLVQVVDLACGEKIPPEVIAALTNDDVTKWAFNAQFERICLSRWLRDHGGFDNAYYSIPEDTVGNYLDPTSWKCTMIWSAYMGLPLSLEGVGAVLGLGKQKLTEGKELIKYFCQPCAPTKPTAVAPATYRKTLRTSGPPSNGTTSVMSRSRCPFRKSSPSSLCRKQSGSNTTSIRKSTTEASPLIWSWCIKP